MGHLICPKGAQQRPQWTEGDQLLLSVPRYLHFTHPWCIIVVNWLASKIENSMSRVHRSRNKMASFASASANLSLASGKRLGDTSQATGGKKESGWTELISADLSEERILPYFFKVPERDRLTRSHEITIVTWVKTSTLVKIKNVHMTHLLELQRWN